MKLTRQQELKLIDLGFKKVLEMLESPTKVARKKKSSSKMKWSAKRKRAFAKAMKAKWAAIKKART